MSHLLTLDALLFNMIGGQLKRFAKARKDLLVAVNEMVSFLNSSSWTEITLKKYTFASCGCGQCYSFIISKHAISS